MFVTQSYIDISHSNTLHMDSLRSNAILVHILLCMS
jgi:hypothetical protein